MGNQPYQTPMAGPEVGAGAGDILPFGTNAGNYYPINAFAPDVYNGMGMQTPTWDYYQPQPPMPYLEGQMPGYGSPYQQPWGQPYQQPYQQAPQSMPQSGGQGLSDLLTPGALQLFNQRISPERLDARLAPFAGTLSPEQMQGRIQNLYAGAALQARMKDFMQTARDPLREQKMALEEARKGTNRFDRQAMQPQWEAQRAQLKAQEQAAREQAHGLKERTPENMAWARQVAQAAPPYQGLGGGNWQQGGNMPGAMPGGNQSPINYPGMGSSEYYSGTGGLMPGQDPSGRVEPWRYSGIPTPPNATYPDQSITMPPMGYTGPLTPTSPFSQYFGMPLYRNIPVSNEVRPRAVDDVLNFIHKGYDENKWYNQGNINDFTMSQPGLYEGQRLF